MVFSESDIQLEIDRFKVYKSKFFYLLLSLIFYFISTSMLVRNTYQDFFLNVLFSLVILFSIYAISRNKYILHSTIILGVILLGCHWGIFLIHQQKNFYIFYYIINILLLSIITSFVLYSITLQAKITADTLFGAICGYFLLGFTWSFIYLLIANINPTAFSVHAFNASLHQSAQDFFYFSFTTMTTLGYGDVLPRSNLARTCSWLEAMTGQIYLAVWISQLVGLRIAQRK